jgi:hypothetical protein
MLFFCRLQYYTFMTRLLGWKDLAYSLLCLVLVCLMCTSTSSSEDIQARISNFFLNFYLMLFYSSNFFFWLFQIPEASEGSCRWQCSRPWYKRFCSEICYSWGGGWTRWRHMKTYMDHIIHIQSKSFLGRQLNDANQEIRSFRL